MEEIGFLGAASEPPEMGGQASARAGASPPLSGGEPSTSEWAVALERLAYAELVARRRGLWALRRFAIVPCRRRYAAGERGWELWRKIMALEGKE